MFDQPLRARLSPGLDRAAGRLQGAGATPNALTALALLAGLGACVAVGTGLDVLALVLWLLNRLLDGLDGPLARRRQANELGGLLDFVADFVVYSGFVVAIAVAHRGARIACVVLLATYLVNNVALLSFSSLSERLALPAGDERSLRLPPGLAEGTETIVVYVLFCVIPSASTVIAWSFAGVVALTAGQRVMQAASVLGEAQDRSASRQSDA
jgi:phosphatidylglycerophosphate synthase